MPKNVNDFLPNEALCFSIGDLKANVSENYCKKSVINLVGSTVGYDLRENLFLKSHEI